MYLHSTVDPRHFQLVCLEWNPRTKKLYRAPVLRQFRRPCKEWVPVPNNKWTHVSNSVCISIIWVEVHLPRFPYSWSQIRQIREKIPSKDWKQMWHTCKMFHDTGPYLTPMPPPMYYHWYHSLVKNHPHRGCHPRQTIVGCSKAARFYDCHLWHSIDMPQANFRAVCTHLKIGNLHSAVSCVDSIRMPRTIRSMWCHWFARDCSWSNQILHPEQSQ